MHQDSDANELFLVLTNSSSKVSQRAEGKLNI